MKVKVDNLSYSFSGKLVLNNVSFNLENGDFLTIVGKNGTGKSTLIKCILKLLKIPNNTVFLEGVDINSLKRLEKIGYVPQKSYFNFEFPISVGEVLSCSYLKKKDSFFNETLNYLDLNKLYFENINSLSGGQIQRIFIARALLAKPSLLILDEPTVGVDNDNIRALHNILKSLKEKGVTIILITHDEEFSIDITDHLLTLNEMTNYTLEKKEKVIWFFSFLSLML